MSCMFAAVLGLLLHGRNPGDCVGFACDGAFRWSGVPWSHGCRVLGGAAQLASMLFGVACECLRLGTVLRSQQPCDHLLVGSQVVMFQGVGVQASPCNSRVQYPANKLQRSGLRALHSAG